jgi:hypothetical protein
MPDLFPQWFQMVNTIAEPAPPYQAHSPTSRAAAAAILPHAGTERSRVLAYIRGHGTIGATDDECQVMLGMNPSTQRPRRIELWTQGWIKDSGFKRATRSGRKAVVWVATDKE